MFVDGYQEAFRVIWISCLLRKTQIVVVTEKK